MFHRAGTGRLTGIILRLKEYSAFITALSGSFRHMPELPGWEIQVRQFIVIMYGGWNPI